MDITITVKVKLSKEGSGPKTDREYLVEEVRQHVEESVDGQSFYDDNDTEYTAEASATVPE